MASSAYNSSSSGYVVLGSFPRKGGSSTNFETAGTSNYVASQVVFSFGSATVPASSSVAITLPYTYSNNPVAWATANTTVAGVVITANVDSGSQITLTNNNASDRAASWFAIGPV